MSRIEKNKIYYMKKEISYCWKCGKELVHYLTGYFNESTGEKVMQVRCENRKCEDGCGNVTHHHNMSLFGRRCRDCGYHVESI